MSRYEDQGGSSCGNHKTYYKGPDFLVLASKGELSGEAVMPIEITFMDNEGNIFALCEFIDYMNSYII
jgi:hypothetical protein